MLRRIGFKDAPYDGAFDPDLGLTSPAEGVTDAAFNATKDLLDALAAQLKNLPARLASSNVTEKKRATDLLASLFTSEVAVAGEGVKLLPRVEGLPRNEVIDYIAKWGNVERFGCYSKPKSTFAIKRKITGEALAAFPDRKLLALVQVGKVGDDDRFERLEVSKADIEAVTRLMGDRKHCGSTEFGWNPKKDFDSYNESVAARRDLPSNAEFAGAGHDRGLP